MAATVRTARTEDASALARIDVLTWTQATSPAPPPEDVESYVFFDERTVPADVLVAEIDGEILGWVKLQRSTPLPAHAHVLEIGGLAVDPSRTGTGVGGQLVEAAVAECRRRGARKVSLRVLAPNEGARRLYERCGFQLEGRLRDEFHLGGAFVDDLLMARWLDAVKV